MRRSVAALCLLVLLLGSPAAPWAQETSGSFMDGSILIGWDNRTCDAGLEGSIRYNGGTSKFQLCTQVVSSGPTGCPTIGDLCTDGSYYIGQVSGNDIYASTAASQSNQTWNNGTSSWTVTGFTSNTDGPGNTAGLVALGDAGSPYDAAVYCDGLSNVHGHSDWYLPARDELNLFWNGGAPVAGVLTDGSWYWSSTEFTHQNVWIQRFNDGSQSNGFTKNAPWAVRCVRRDSGGTSYDWTDF